MCGANSRNSVYKVLPIVNAGASVPMFSLDSDKFIAVKPRLFDGTLITAYLKAENISG